MDGEDQQGNKGRKSLDSKQMLRVCSMLFKDGQPTNESPDPTEDLGYDWKERERTHWVDLKLSLKRSPENQR